eukprot:1315885-Amorphochlora_amoeboformis.AAC.1
MYSGYGRRGICSYKHREKERERERAREHANILRRTNSSGTGTGLMHVNDDTKAIQLDAGSVNTANLTDQPTSISSGTTYDAQGLKTNANTTRRLDSCWVWCIRMIWTDFGEIGRIQCRAKERWYWKNRDNYHTYTYISVQ